MRILEVVLSLGMGGQEQLVVRMAQAFHERGHDVGVVTLTDGGTLRGELGIPSDARVVGSVGRLVEEKDYPLGAWHERVRPIRMPVRVEAGATARLTMNIPVQDR